MKRKSPNDGIIKSYSLFGSNADVGMDRRVDNHSKKKVEKDKDPVPEKLVRTQDTVKEPDVPEQRVEDFGDTVKQAKPAGKKNRASGDTKAVRSTRQGQRDKVSEPGDSKPQKPTKRKQGTGGKPAAENDGAERGTGKRQKINVFPPSTSLQSVIKIDSKPIPTDEFDKVEISIKGEHYHVSPWAVVNGEYIQGLDSKFLVHSFVANKRQINKEKQDK